MKNQDITVSKIDSLRAAVIVTAVVLTGCKMGPNFHPPEVPKTTRYTASPTPKHTKQAPSPKGKAQHFRYNQYISDSWWTVFHSPTLNSLIQKGLRNNPTVEMSLSSLRSAQANLLATIGPSLFPTVSTQFSGYRERTNLLAAGINLEQNPQEAAIVTLDNPFNLYNTSIGVSYSPDIFGGTRRQLEALHAEIERQYFELEATYLTLTANIVTSAITIASLNAQIQTTNELINCQQKWLKITKNNYKLGHTTRIEVLTRENRLHETQASLPPLKDALAKKTNALSTLIGELPSEANIPSLRLEKLHLPTQLPVSLPSQFVRQRPDIRSAESLLHKASAEIGVATANIFPKFVLAANYGWNGTLITQLFSPTNVIWNYGGQVAQTLFQGGALIAKRKVAIANFEYAAAQYRKTVLSSLQNVADVLRALEFDAELLAVQANTEKNAKVSFNIMRVQHKLGKVDYPTLLSVQERYLLTHLNVIQAEARRLSDTAALFQSLGGGWWNRNNSPPSIEKTV